MKSSLTLLVLLLLLMSILAGYNVVAGFWLGLWQGFIAPCVFVASLFKSNLSTCEIHNNGGWYNFGCLFGLACLFGGGGNRMHRT